MSDFLARRTEYFQDCQQMLEAGLAEAKTQVASALSRFMAGNQGSKETYEDWLRPKPMPRPAGRGLLL